MAPVDRSHTRRNGPPGFRWARELFACVMLLALTAAVALRAIVSTDALAPVVATLLLLLAATTAAGAVLCRGDKLRMMCFDVAGVLTFVGVAITILIDPDQLIRLVDFSDRSD